MSEPKMSVDPVTFEILSHRLYQITQEIGTTLERVGGTVNTTQMRDYLAGLYQPTATSCAPATPWPGTWAAPESRCAASSSASPTRAGSSPATCF